MTILLVDDDPGFRQAMEMYLRDQGRTVHTAADGMEGLTKLNENKIDFIISDVYMPVMDGIKFQKAVQETPEFAQLPFLFVSGYDDDHTMEAVQTSKNCGFMKKARPVEELEEWITYLSTPVGERKGTLPGLQQRIMRTERPGRTDRYGR